MKKLHFLLFFLLVNSNLFTQIIRIPTDQATIQDGINVASSGDTIIVNPGTYVENINFNGKNIVLGSLFLTTQDTSYISQTIIDGNQNGSVVTFEHTEDSTALLSGFTITNGSGTLINTLHNGGGILCQDASPRLAHLRITQNSVDGSGGGIYMLNSSAVLQHLDVTNNHAGGAAGIYFRNSFNTDLEGSPQPKLSYSTVRSNTAVGRAGGIYCDYALATISNVEVTKNTANDGGAFYIGNAKANLVNVTMADNAAMDEGGVFFLDGGEATIVNSIIWNNNPQSIYRFPDPVFSTVTLAYSDIQGGESIGTGSGVLNWEEGNIDEDPLFLAPDNYSLQNTSPCIDAGAAFYEWQDETITDQLPETYFGMNPDMGAYENDPLSDMATVVFSNNLVFEAYPNPFSDQISLNLHLPHATAVEAVLYNALGHPVQTLTIPVQHQQQHEVNWPLSGTPSGFYFIRLQTEEEISRAVMVVKE